MILQCVLFLNSGTVPSAVSQASLNFLYADFFDADLIGKDAAFDRSRSISWGHCESGHIESDRFGQDWF